MPRQCRSLASFWLAAKVRRTPNPPCQISLLHRHRFGSVTTSTAGSEGEQHLNTEWRGGMRAQHSRLELALSLSLSEKERKREWNWDWEYCAYVSAYTCGVCVWVSRWLELLHNVVCVCSCVMYVSGRGAPHFLCFRVCLWLVKEWESDCEASIV